MESNKFIAAPGTGSWPRCRQCGEPFPLTKPNLLYCSYACQQEWHRERYHQVRQWWKEHQEEEQRRQKNTGAAA
jgi:hypothetical protein